MLRLCCCMRASQGVTSLVGAQALGDTGFSSCGSWALGQTCSVVVVNRLSFPLAWRMLPDQGSNWSPAFQGRLPSTGPSGKPCYCWISLVLCAVLSCFSHVWFFVTPWTVAHQAPLSMGFSRQECWSGLPCPPPGTLPDPGFEPTSPALLHCRWILYPLNHLGSPLNKS